MKKSRTLVVLMIISVICSAILLTSCKGPVEFEHAENNWNNAVVKKAEDEFSGVFLLYDGSNTNKDLEIPYEMDINREYKKEGNKNIGIIDFKLELKDITSGIDNVILPQIIQAAKKKNGGDYTGTYKSLKGGEEETYTINLDDFKAKDLSKLKIGAKVWVNLENNIQQNEIALKILDIYSNIAEPEMRALCDDIVLKKGTNQIVKLEDLISKIIADNKGLMFTQEEIKTNKLEDFSAYLKVMSPYKLDNLGDKEKKRLFKEKKLEVNKDQTSRVAQYDEIKKLTTTLIRLVDGGEMVAKLTSILKDITGSQSNDLSDIIGNLASNLSITKIDMVGKKKDVELRKIETHQSLNAYYSEQDFQKKIMDAIKENMPNLDPQSQLIIQQFTKRALAMALTVNYEGEFHY